MSFLSRILGRQYGPQARRDGKWSGTSLSPESVPRIADVAFTQAGIDNLPEKTTELLSYPQVADKELLHLFDTARGTPEMKLSKDEVLSFLVRIKQEFAQQPELAIARTSPSSAYISLQYIRQHGLGGVSARIVYPGGVQKQDLYTVTDFLDTLIYEAGQRGYRVVDVVPASG